MELGRKQIIRELFHNKIFLVFLFMLSGFTAFLYFFVHFSVDENLRFLDSLMSLGKKQQEYRSGMMSNIILARNIIAILTGLTGFVFVMFFSRFFQNNQKQIGSLKALGFKDSKLCGFFVCFSFILSLIGEVVGLGISYFAADLLIANSEQSYLVTNLRKGLNPGSLILGLLLPLLVYTGLTFATYGSIRGKEIGLLLTGNGSQVVPKRFLMVANKVAEVFPKSRRLSVRLALRKPIAVFLILLSVMSFSTMFIMAYSLTLSSQTIVESQTIGHSYLYHTNLTTPQTGKNMQDSLAYLDTEGLLNEISRTMVGLEEQDALFKLLDKDYHKIPLPTKGEVIIGIELAELYDIKEGNLVRITVLGQEREMKVAGIAFNANTNWVYLSKSELAELLQIPENSYTGILSNKNQVTGGTVVTQQQKLEVLQRGAVSNRSSAIINQAIGCFVGCILLYLALLLNFQDSTNDILILHLMGHPMKQIRKTLLDIYLPILWIFFWVTLWPSIKLVKTILKSLSLQIEDYMPFQTNVFVILGIFMLLTILYYAVLFTFHMGIKTILQKEESICL